MLIRSQKKSVLLNIKKSMCIDIDSKNSICVEFANETFVIGEYSSKEKAMKVLDQIQNEYQYIQECKHIGVGSSCPEFVFQMPQDEEVQL